MPLKIVHRAVMLVNRYDAADQTSLVRFRARPYRISLHKAESLAKCLSININRCIVIFQGPNQYIVSLSWVTARDLVSLLLDYYSVS